MGLSGSIPRKGRSTSPRRYAICLPPGYSAANIRSSSSRGSSGGNWIASLFTSIEIAELDTNLKGMAISSARQPLLGIRLTVSMCRLKYFLFRLRDVIISRATRSSIVDIVTSARPVLRIVSVRLLSGSIYSPGEVDFGVSRLKHFYCQN